jgi:hypothetical protein
MASTLISDNHHLPPVRQGVMLDLNLVDLDMVTSNLILKSIPPLDQALRQ